MEVKCIKILILNRMRCLKLEGGGADDVESKVPLVWKSGRAKARYETSVRCHRYGRVEG